VYFIIWLLCALLGWSVKILCQLDKIKDTEGLTDENRDRLILRVKSR